MMNSCIGCFLFCHHVIVTIIITVIITINNVILLEVCRFHQFMHNLVNLVIFVFCMVRFFVFVITCNFLLESIFVFVALVVSE